ncbi:Type II/IV secretion system ATP hydrolase TadA/VirB11/CpaF, TadA subfamily [hydrothermal vent metagenome]|uniref:Type II/IV secretion system ATP hydrolase TadA/VirB11/CpaF, TadA subfamily n=1 Tax=hydrothermal vent metagenome TaxID=652676 RepID=A0A3B0ZBQ8_9ZZZZ
MFDIIVETNKGTPVNNLRCVLNRCTIGKGRDNLVQLRGWSIGNIHTEITQTADGIFVEHKNDSGHTLVGDNKINSKHGPLTENDVIEIGNYYIRIDASKYAEQEETKRKMQSKDILNTQEIRNVKGIFRDELLMWRKHVHQELLNNMDLQRTDVGNMSEKQLRENVQGMIKEILDNLGDELPEHINRETLAKDVLNETVGLGPLEDILEDETITEVMVNCFDDIYIERDGKLQPTDVIYSDHEAVMATIERIISPLGRRIDESSPMVDARLKDGSRVNAIIPPLALRGPCITIRKFSKKKLSAKDIVAFGAISAEMMDFLKITVESKQNVIISGGTGSGKTTLLNVLSNYIPKGERVITVEDAAELRLQQPHLVSLESRPPNIEGKGQITIRDLVRNCLRMRPDRIVVGECRGAEALDMLQAMNTGHEGSLTTAHANTPRDMLSRLEVMVLMAGMELPIQAIREQISSAINIVVQQSRFPDGSRKITHISEITGMESGTIQMHDIFRFKQDGFDDDGRVKGNFVPTGQVPEFYEQLRARGLQVDMSIFN